MKKVFALLLTFTIICLNSYQFVMADDVIIGGNSYVNNVLTDSDYKKLNYSGLLAEYLRRGGSVDLTNVDPDYGIDDVIDEIGEVFTDILKDTGKSLNWLGNQVFTNEGTAYPENLKPRMNNELALLGKSIFDNLASISLSQNDDIPTPEPDLNYASQISTINGYGFNEFFDSIAIINTNYNVPSMNTWSRGYSFYSPNDNIYSPLFGTCSIFEIGSIYIRQVGDNEYALNYNFPLIPNFSACNPADGSFSRWVTQGNRMNRFNNNNLEQYTYWGGWNNNALNPAYATGSFSGTLFDCMNYLSYHFHNINIYVDGVLWSYAGNSNDSYSIDLGTGTIIPVTNGRVEWKYDDEIYIDIDLMWQILDDFLNSPNERLIKFSDIEDCIVDADGQKAIAVQVIQEPEKAIDDLYVMNYGTLVPAFPVFINYPVDLRQVANISTIGIIDVIPDDIIEILGIGILGMLFVTLIHRLLE